MFNGVGVYNLVYIGGYRSWISEIFGFQPGKVLRKNENVDPLNKFLYASLKEVLIQLEIDRFIPFFAMKALKSLKNAMDLQTPWPCLNILRL